MGLVSNLLTEQKIQSSEALRTGILTEGHQIYDRGVGLGGSKLTCLPLTEDKTLTKLFESSNEKDQKRAALTCLVLEQQEKFMQSLMNTYGEATVMSTLGALTPKLLDVVRIFYPAQVAHMLTDIQPLTQQNGQIFIIKPRYSMAGGGVNKGDEVFKTMTDGSYASEVYSVALGTGDGATTVFAGTLPIPVRKDGSLKVLKNGVVVATDPGAGYSATTSTFTGSDGNLVTVVANYQTGAVSVTFAVAPAAAQVISLSSLVDSETNVSHIRQLEVSLDLVPVRAQAHPLKVVWSMTSQLAASAQAGLDIQDLLTTLMSQFVRVERDQLIVTAIANSAQTDSGMNFDAVAPSNYPKWQKYQEMELKLNYAESGIQNANGHRGGVSWIVGGYNASDIWRQVRGFQADDIINPMGAHRIGTLRNGTVDVIKAPFMNTNTYCVGFKGYMPGDSATILAEWIPLYMTPVWQSPDLQGQRGVMSMYDLFVNNSAYYRKGTISNYGA